MVHKLQDWLSQEHVLPHAWATAEVVAEATVTLFGVSLKTEPK